MGLEDEAVPLVSETEFSDAKSYFQKDSNGTVSLHEHLKKIIVRLLEERPRDSTVIFENLSKQVKENIPVVDVEADDDVDRSTEVALAEIQSGLFRRHGDDLMDLGMDDGVDTALPNLMYLHFMFEQAGIGFNREEMVRIQLAIKQLVDTYPLHSARFWGKIFGTEQNYYIAEVEFRQGEEPEEAAEEETQEERQDEEEEDEEDTEKLPKITWKPPPEVPKEERGSGCNKSVYFVCNEPGKDWVKLPSVTPQQIQVARKIKKLFTGNLNAPINSYPPFTGNEGNLLRAQIARISAATLVSPLGFYHFDEEEEEAEEGGVRENFVENEEFAGLSLPDLIDPSMSNWVHHSLHILPQGRCSWWNPAKQDDEDEEADEEQEDESIVRKSPVEPEVGPPLLTPLSADHSVDGIPAWTVRASSRLVPRCAVAVLSSNLWPGAHTICQKKLFENIYIGWGQKYSAFNYSPPAPPEVMQEFPEGPDVIEMADPTPEDEAALREALERADEVAGESEEEDGEDEQ